MPPGQDKVGYPSATRTGWGTPPPPPRPVLPGQDGVPPPLARTAEPALATRWAVCLLRSRRRTVLLNLVSLPSLGTNHIPFSDNNHASVRDEIHGSKRDVYIYQEIF